MTEPTNQPAQAQTGQAQTAQPAEAKPQAGTGQGLFEGAPAAQSAAQSAEPKLYAGKYKSVDDLEKAYGEAQKLLGKKQPPKEETQAPDLAGIGKRFQEQRAAGKFDPEVAEALRAFGIEPGFIQQAEQAVKTQQRTAAEKALGRSVDWEQWNTWQAKNLTEAQRSAAMALIGENDYSLLDKLVAKFEAAGPEAADGKAAALPDGKVGAAGRGVGGSGGFESPEAARKWLKERRGLSKPQDAEEWERRLAATPRHIRDKLK